MGGLGPCTWLAVRDVRKTSRVNGKDTETLENKVPCLNLCILTTHKGKADDERHFSGLYYLVLINIICIRVIYLLNVLIINRVQKDTVTGFEILCDRCYENLTKIQYTD